MKKLVTIAAPMFALAWTLPTGAACNPIHLFGQSPAPQNGYFYVIPTGTNTQDSIIGRFWEVGNWAGANEGDCPDENWVLMCDAPYPCRGNPGTTRYLAGGMNVTTSHGTCKNLGCPSLDKDLNLLVQDTNASGGAGFFLARVNSTPPAMLAWDYSRLVTDLTYTPIPKPAAVQTARSGARVTLTLTLPAANGGFYGLSGQTAAGPGNISGYRVYRFTGTADPGRNRGSWIADTVSRTYTGSDVTVTGFTVDCSSTALDVFLALALEFDGGTVTTDYVGQSTRIVCDPRGRGTRG
jgi:hypothetical protein